jgi:hypothetical protein
MTLYQYAIGLSAETLTNIESLTVSVRPPKHGFSPYSKPLPLGNGTVRGGGWPTASWNWKILGRAERDQLRTFCPGASAEVFITTRISDNADEYKTFSAVMLWPQEEEKDAGKRPDFTLKFQRLAEVTP